MNELKLKDALYSLTDWLLLIQNLRQVGATIGLGNGSGAVHSQTNPSVVASFKLRSGVMKYPAKLTKTDAQTLATSAGLLPCP
jgi:hypothetical protein